MTKVKTKEEENKDLALTTENAEGIELVRQLTGEYGINDNPNKLKWINFSGKDGNYTFKEGDEVQVIGTAITGTIFKVTKKVQSDMNSEHNVRSNEFASMEDITILDGKTGDVKESGNYIDLKPKYDLKLLNILYLYVAELDRYCKLQIGGASLGGLWDYLGSFGSKDTVARWVTNFGVEEAEFKDKKGLKVKYFKATFTKGAEVTSDKLPGILAELSKVNIELSSVVEKKLELKDTGEEINIDAINL